MTRIHQIKNTDGEELSGVQIIVYFLRIQVQPMQARKNPLWMYSGVKDVDRLSKDVSMKDLEKLVRHFTSLNRTHTVPSSCCVEPYSASHALPQVSVFFRIEFAIFLTSTFSLVCLLSCILFVMRCVGPPNSFFSSSPACRWKVGWSSRCDRRFARILSS
jgi:hypothetical protein